jgi:hypothetical protein
VGLDPVHDTIEEIENGMTHHTHLNSQGYNGISISDPGRFDIDRYAKAPPQAEADVDRRFDRFERALPPGIDRGPSCVVQKR